MVERDERIRIEGKAADLLALQRDLVAELGDEITVLPVSEEVPGELREPVVVALIVAVASTASVAIKTIGSIIERRMLHTERMEGFRIYREHEEREVSVAALPDLDAQPALCLFDIGEDMLDDHGLDSVVMAFEEFEENADLVRRLQGTVAFRFAGQEERGEEIWLDERVLAWGRALYGKLPHLLYYLDPRPGLGAMAFPMHCFIGSSPIPGEKGDGGEWTIEEEGLYVASHHLVAAAVFADELAEDWRRIVPPLVGTLDPGFGAEVMRLVEVGLDRHEDIEKEGEAA